MNKFELALVISGKLPAEKLKEKLAKIESIITSNKGKITNRTDWGKKKMSYKINKEEEAYYYIMNFQIPAFTNDMNKKIRLTEDIMRYLLIRQK